MDGRLHSKLCVQPASFGTSVCVRAGSAHRRLQSAAPTVLRTWPGTAMSQTAVLISFISTEGETLTQRSQIQLLMFLMRELWLYLILKC